MRSLLFRHELKSKHIKNIKSKTYHRLLKKDKLKANSILDQMDPEAAKELAMKQEYERAKVIDFSPYWWTCVGLLIRYFLNICSLFY